MGTGLPLLLADALALPELVTHGSNGFLFRPGDVAGAADAIRMLADHPERWPEMGRLSLEKALAHSLDNTIARFSALYVRAIESLAVPHGVRKGFPNRGTDLAHRSGRS
jgi:glycosyltransferase involved in cell wall biosynthesis